MWRWLAANFPWLVGRWAPTPPPKYIVDFETIEVVSDDGTVMVELENIGEGWDGDYDPQDPEDEPLLRFTLYRKYEQDLDQQRFADVCDTDAYEDGEWAQVRDGSYCTRIDARLPRDKVAEAARYLLEQVQDDLRDLHRRKRQYEELSWITISPQRGVMLMR